MFPKRLKRVSIVDPAAGEWLKGEKLAEGLYAYNVPRKLDADYFALDPLYIPDDWDADKSPKGEGEQGKA